MENEKQDLPEGFIEDSIDGEAENIADADISVELRNEDNMNELIGIDPKLVKRCTYPTCHNDIAADSQFEYCEKCRALAARNALALSIDPCAPLELERRYEVCQTLLHNLTGEEILRGAARVEYVYLEFQKAIKLHNIQQNIRKAFKPTSEIVEEQRARNEALAPIEKRLRAKADRGKKQRSERIDKLKNLLGTDDTDAVKKFMDEDIDL